MRTIYIDMDSTIFDYISEYCKRFFEDTGIRKSPNSVYKQAKKYHINDIFGIRDEYKYKFLDKRFFEEMTAYNNAIETISYLRQFFDVRFVTHIVTKEAFIGKVNRLEKEFDWFSFDEHLISIKDKHLLQPSIIIDDNPFVLEKCMENKFLVIKFKQPWNEDVKTNFEVNNWEEVKNLLEKIK